MWTIVDQTTGKVLFSKWDNQVLEAQVAIQVVYSEEIPEGKELYYDFENNEFKII